MDNYNTKNLNTMLYIHSNDDLSDSFGNELPYPQKHEISSNRYVYGWLLDGYFKTKDGYEFLNDVIARMMITFPRNEIRKKSQQIIDTKELGIKLKMFQNLKSLKNNYKNFDKANQVEVDDQVFWALKIFVEIYISDTNFLAFDTLERFAFDNFVDKTKDRSTLRAKCRSIWNYYHDRDFIPQLGYTRKFTDKENEMSRRENMIKVRENEALKTKQKIFNILSNNMFIDDYKKKNGKYNISKIAKDSKTSRNTTMKYIKEFERVA